MARIQLERARKLQKTRSASVELLNQRQAELEQLRAQIDEQDAENAQALADLKRCTISAPFKALVVERLADEGELATPGSPLLRVQDLDHLELSAKVQVQDVPLLRSAQSLQFIALGADYPVTVRVVVQRIDRRTRSQEVRLTFLAAPPLVGATGILLLGEGLVGVGESLSIGLGLLEFRAWKRVLVGA